MDALKQSSILWNLIPTLIFYCCPCETWYCLWSKKTKASFNSACKFLHIGIFLMHTNINSPNRQNCMFRWGNHWGLPSCPQICGLLTTSAVVPAKNNPNLFNHFNPRVHFFDTLVIAKHQALPSQDKTVMITLANHD